MAPGNYRIVLTVDGKEYSQTVRVDPDPNLPPGQIAEEELVMPEEEEEEEETDRTRIDD